MRLRLLPTLLLLLLPLARPVFAQPAAPGSTPPPAQPSPGPTLTDAQLQQAFAAWQRARGAVDAKAAEEAKEALLALRREFDLGSLDSVAAAFLRAAAQARASGDAREAVALAQVAVALAPDLPAAHLGLARASLAADATALGRAFAGVWAAAEATWRNPGTARATVANLGAALLLGVVATAVVLAAVLFLRRARLYFHDVHHLLPRAVAGWHAAALALLVVALPPALGWGLVAVLVVPLVAVSRALDHAERAVAAVLVALLGLVPWAAGALVERTSFSGTPAEQVAALESGGLGAEAVASQVEARHAEGRAGFPELFALGRLQLRRGLGRSSQATLSAAAALRPGDARLLTNLGNSHVATGDLEGALQLYQDAARRDARLAAPLFNLSVLRARRAEQLPPGEAARELGLAEEARARALALEPGLAARSAPVDGRALSAGVLVSPPLEAVELARLAEAPEAGRRVAAQLALGLTGAGGPAGAAILGGASALLLLLAGLVGGPLRSARGCGRCGGAACRRCDPSLPPGSTLCAECTNAFVRKDAVSPHVLVRKQLELERAHARHQRMASALALLVSGAGHLFSGRPVRGALYAFTFLCALGGLLLQLGLTRVPHATRATALLALAPLAPLLLAVHLLSVRGMLRHRAGD
ncbi:MAG: hypothetical protein L0Y64_17040 [Myxococcaceae bacterium]|nr:hypothetical protein [Myxococcaceae bacterium]